MKEEKMTITETDIRKDIKENDVQFFRLMFTDVLGMLKNIEIPMEDGALEKILGNEVMVDGSSIAGFVGIDNSDLYLHPDLDTWMIFPWDSGNGTVAGFICDVYNPDNTPFAGDPRGVLKKNLSRLEGLGFSSFNLGPEPEFFLFKTDEKGEPTTNIVDDGFYFDLPPLDEGDAVRQEIVNTLKKMGYTVEASHHEAAISQQEIDFKYAPAVKACDNIQLFKLVVKTVAKKNGLHATFMAKPKYGINGSGMHFNMSLFNKEGKNAFYDPEGDLELSDAARHFIGGVLKHAYGFAAITNPTVNSFKRLVPGFEAPVYVAWGPHNRTPLIRIPSSRGMGTRVELRQVDPTANPYLALAVMLGVGLEGIEDKIEAPHAIEENIFHMTPEERKERGISNLPGSLNEAVTAFEADEVITKVLGEHIVNAFVNIKRNEWIEYSISVSQWELNKYLKNY